MAVLRGHVEAGADLGHAEPLPRRRIEPALEVGMALARESEDTGELERVLGVQWMGRLLEDRLEEEAEVDGELPDPLHEVARRGAPAHVQRGTDEESHRDEQERVEIVVSTD